MSKMSHKKLWIILILALAFLLPNAGGAQTNTPTDTPTETPTATPTRTPTANTSRHAALIRALNSGRIPSEPFKLGTMLEALWRSRHSGGALSVDSDATKYDVAAGVYVINGLPVTEDGANAQVLPATVNTTAAQYRKAALCIDAAGTYRLEVGTTAASQAAAVKPPCSDFEAEVGYLEIPNSFTATSTSVTAGMCKQAATAASQVVF
jgi:hypothetical protein